MDGAARVPARAPRRLPFGLLRDLDRPGEVFRHLGPDWFASIMGTGAVANAAARLPWQFPGLRAAAIVVWALAAALLALLTAAWAVHWARHTANARAHARDPVMAQFWGAPPIALLTVGAGTLLLGADWIGRPAALAIDWTLWTVGTALGLATAVWIPYLMHAGRDARPDSAFAGWLLPVLPPLVSSATGALLIPFLPAGRARLAMVLLCYAMFGISLLATFVVLPQVCRRVLRRGAAPAPGVPAVWLVLGPLGQSVAAANLLPGAATGALPARYLAAADVFGLGYGLPVLGFALCWLALAGWLTVRAGSPFSLTWWGFVYPVGTCVVGTTALAARTGWPALAAAAVALDAVLVAAWLVVAARTAHGSARGRLFLPARATPAGTGATGYTPLL